MIKAIIFDCFGVIIGKGFNNTYAAAGGDPKQDKQFIDDLLCQANLGMITENEFNKIVARHLDLSLNDWQAILLKAELPDEALLSYIRELRQSYKTAILSNSNKGVLRDKVGKAWLKQCFDEVVSSAEVGLIKPNPDIYNLTAARLRVAPRECVFIDDHSSFVEAAKSVGMRAILYQDLNNLKLNLEALLSVNPKA